MPTTPILLLPYPDPADSADVPTDLHELADRVEAVRGAAGGIASLDGGGKIPVAQLPNGIFVPVTAVGVPNGVASLDAGAKVPLAQMPDQSATYQPRSEEGAANGYASLDAGGKVPAAQLPPAPASYTTQVVSNLAAAIASPGAQALVQVAVALGYVERVLMTYDATIPKWVPSNVYHSDVFPEVGNVNGWTRVGFGRRFPYQAFVNAGLKPQVRAACIAQDTQNDQNAAELRIVATGDGVYRGAGGQPEGGVQIAYDGRYAMSYGAWASLDTGWCDVYPTVAAAPALVVNPSVATNDGNGHVAAFRGVRFALRWAAI
jgi:hypothetical protein